MALETFLNVKNNKVFVELFQPREPRERKVIERQDKLADIIARLRLVEENIENVMKRIIAVENNLLDRINLLEKRIKDIGERVSELEKKALKLEKELELIRNSLKDFAKKEDVKVIEKYIDFLNPEKFVTYEDLKRIIKRLRGE